MAIQDRRGPYSKFDPQKMLPGEWATVLSGDPHAQDGRSVYKCFAAGDVKRMATYEDMVDNIRESSGEAIDLQIDEKLNGTLRKMKDGIYAMETATSEAIKNMNHASDMAILDAEDAASRANTAATSADNAAGRADTAAGDANTAADNANSAAERAEKYVLGEISEKTVVFTEHEDEEDIASGDSMKILFGKILKKFHAIADALNTRTEDSGWKTLTVATGYSHYAGQPLECRRIGKQVQIRGAVKNDAEVTSGVNPVTIANLPAGYRPSGIVGEVCQGSGRNRHLIQAMPAGTITFSRYAETSAYQPIDAGAWIRVDLMYFVD